MVSYLLRLTGAVAVQINVTDVPGRTVQQVGLARAAVDWAVDLGLTGPPLQSQHGGDDEEQDHHQDADEHQAEEAHLVHHAGVPAVPESRGRQYLKVDTPGLDLLGVSPGLGDGAGDVGSVVLQGRGVGDGLGDGHQVGVLLQLRPDLGLGVEPGGGVDAPGDGGAGPGRGDPADQLGQISLAQLD